MQIYKKEKIRTKKDKMDKENQSLTFLASLLRYNHQYKSFLFKSNNLENIKKSYLELCKKYKKPEHFNKDKKRFVDELDFFLLKEINSKFKENKNKHKKSNSEIIFDFLEPYKKTHSYEYRSLEKKKEIYDIKNFFRKTNLDTLSESEIQENTRYVFEFLNKFKKLFSKQNIENPLIFNSLAFITKNKLLWKQKDYDFKVKSKNLENTILDLFNYFFFDYPITKNELLLVTNDAAMKDFIHSKSMKKTVFSHYENIGLTKKQVNKIKDYRSSIKHTHFNYLLLDIKLMDIIDDEFVVRTLVFKNNKSLLEEYAYYVKNVIFKDPMFSKEQIEPLYDYSLHLKETMERENKTFTFKNRCVYNLYQSMEEWHKELHKINSSKLEWEKSDTILEERFESFKNVDSIDKFSFENYSYYEFEELNNSKKLIQEGKRMKHCVGSYDKQCYKGMSRIFTLKYKGYSSFNVKHLVTIQIYKDVITQVRGTANKMASSKERNIISTWASRNGIIYRD